MSLTEPWPGYPPELNAGRMETGVGAPTWGASAAMWSTFAALVVEAGAVILAEITAVTANWNGLAPMQLTAVTGPFLGWLAEMEAVAAANALSCLGVAEAYAVATNTMIPTPIITANRVAELTAESTNFFGINEGLILFLNQQYGQYWVENGGTMLSYDEAVQLATLPKPSSPPPPLSDAGQALGVASDALSQSPSSLVDPALSGIQQVSSTGPSPATQAPSDIMQSMMSSAPQLLQAPGQLLQQSGSSLTSPMQSLMSPVQSLMSEFGGSTHNPETLTGAGPWSSTFASPATMSNAESMTGTSVAGTGGGAILGGGLNGGSMLGAYPASGNGLVKSQQVFSGVPTTATRPELSLTANSAPMASGGGMPMVPPGAAAAHGATGTQRRDSDLVMSLNPVGGEPPDRRL